MTTDIAAGSPPKVLFWFKAYAGFLAFLYFALAVAALIYFLGKPGDGEMHQRDHFEEFIVLMVMLIFGLALGAACLVPFFVSPRPWLWTYNLVLICVGMTSACFWPASIPLLIAWLKPEAKRYFGKS